MASSISNQTEETWRSKLGASYSKAYIEQNEKRLFAELQHLRHLPENRDCADCHSKNSTMWASVNLGVFLCLACGSHHRSLGTHVSLPKGCTGTYLWGPDELQQMKLIGNKRAYELYGDTIPAGLTNTDTHRWKQYLIDKYVHKKYAGTQSKQKHLAKELAACPSSPPILKEERLNDINHGTFEGSNSDFFTSFGEPSSPDRENHLYPKQSKTKQPTAMAITGEPHETRSGAPKAKSGDFFADFGL